MNHASLFSGIGGAEVAAQMMGWQNLFHCEIQEFPRKVLQYWFPNSESYEDITKTDFHQWQGKVDILTGGFPCQPFSVAGRRKGEDDHRYLWPQMLRAIREIKPTWVVGENVIVIKTMVDPGQETKMGRTDDFFEENYIYREESRFTLEKICQELEAAGYSVQPLNIPACSVGAPHRRERVWIVAHRTDSGAETLQQERKKEFMPLDLLPTPTAIDRGSGRINKSPSPGAAERPTLALAAIQGLLPTPCATEATKFTKTFNPNSQMGKSLTALAISGMIPSPSSKKKTSGKTFQLNPLYVEEMMGFPLMWTALPFLSLNGEQNQ